MVTITVNQISRAKNYTKNTRNSKKLNSRLARPRAQILYIYRVAQKCKSTQHHQYIVLWLLWLDFFRQIVNQTITLYHLVLNILCMTYFVTSITVRVVQSCHIN